MCAIIGYNRIKFVRGDVIVKYVESKVLQKDESIVSRIELHPLKLVLAWIWGILGFWLILIPTIKAIKLSIYYMTTELVITNKKIIEKYGLVSVHCDEMNLDKIENITVNSSFWGRIFGYGNVCIQGTNRNNINFNGVKKPEEVRKLINNNRG